MGALLLVAQAAPVQISAEGFVSVGLLLVVIAAAWKLSSQLTRIDVSVKAVVEKQVTLEPIPGRVADLEGRMGRAESDINDLWEESRGRRPSR